mgnify:CR=1 FL=1
MQNKKIIWLDVGTHFAQEYSAIFGSNFNFFNALIRRLISWKVFGRGHPISYSQIRILLESRSFIKRNRNLFYIIFVEANTAIFQSKKIYKEADIAINMALTDDTEDGFSLQKLYIKNHEEMSQSSSIYREKKEKNKQNKDDYMLVNGVTSAAFMTNLEKYLREKFRDYALMLRINCEGAEDSVIYSAQDVFGKKLKLISGSLKDVGVYKGKDALYALNQFIDDKDIKLTYFSPEIHSWSEGFSSILRLVSQSKD